MRGVLKILIYILLLFDLAHEVNSQCKQNWLTLSGYCMKLHRELPRLDAYTACGNEGADLILPRLHGVFPDHNIIWLVITTILRQPHITKVWIDIKYLRGRWVDHNGNRVSHNDQRWASPNQARAPRGKHCVALLRSGKWSIHGCGIKLPFICIYKPTTTTTTTKTTTTITTAISTKPTPCSPNQCKNGVCQPVANKKFPNYDFTCICPDRYGGPKCTLIDDPCTNDPTAKCRNNGTCEVKEQPGKNDWFCVCPGELKIGQAKDCSGGKSEATLLHEKRMKLIMISTVIIPSWFFGVAWAIWCVIECVQIGELPDLDSFSDCSSSDSEAEDVGYNLKRFWARKRNENKRLIGKGSKRVTFSNIVTGQSISNSRCVNEQKPPALSEGSKRLTFSSITGSEQSVFNSSNANEISPLAIQEDIAIQHERNEEKDIEKARSLPITVSSTRKSDTDSATQEKEGKERLGKLSNDRNLRVALLQAKLDQREKTEGYKGNNLSDSKDKNKDSHVVKRYKAGHNLSREKLISDIFNKNKYNITKDKGESSKKGRDSKKTSPEKARIVPLAVNSTKKSDANSSIPQKEEKKHPGQLSNERNLRLALLQAKLDRARVEKAERDSGNYPSNSIDKNEDKKDAKRYKPGHAWRHGKFISDIFNREKYNISKEKGGPSGKKQESKNNK